MRETRANLDRYRASVTEDDMQRAIEDLAKLRGARVFHVRNSSKSPELVDLPDLLIIDPRAGRVIFAELKSQKREITHGQAGVLQLLSECSRVESFLVRPVPDAGEVGYQEFLEWMGGS